ncbi:odorant receptor 9a-like isoform X2 [Polyergus mexicanus]|uniref:odorant receptor 9a-like isoform X2 n=1 Tax=Polyergus mexicanus TaxID=615972 RepID=UPI0038B4852C
MLSIANDICLEDEAYVMSADNRMKRVNLRYKKSGEYACVTVAILLLTLGLWPYQQSIFDRLRFIFFLGILTTAILFQFTIFLNSKCTADFVVKILSNALFFTTFVIHYIFFAINIETVKDLLTQLQYVYDKLKNEYENAIVEKYNYNAERYTIALTAISMGGIFVLIIAQLWSNIINIILPTNVSQSRRLPIMTEYFVDQEKYYFLIILHLNAALCIGVAGMVSVGTMLIAYLEHTCGLFKISSYRIKRAMRVIILQNINPKNNILMLEEIRCAVDIHRQAMKLSKILVSKFEAMLFCLITTGVISLSLNLFQIFRIASIGESIDKILIPSLFVFCSILYMFCANYVGQNITDYNNRVFDTVYNVQWYIAPLHIQKLMLFLLQSNAQDFTLGVGGFFIGSLECFATLVKTSVSYFTVIYSTQ